MWRIIDRCAIVGMGLGLALMLQPWWTTGFQIGFFVLLCMTLLQIVSSHCLPTNDEVDP